MYLGLDAGNSKTVAFLCRPDGSVAGVARTGCGDIYGVGDIRDAVQAVTGCVAQVLGSAGVTAAQVRSAAFRMAGVDWPEDAEFWRRTLGSAWPDLQQMSVLNDGFAPIRCGEPSGVALAVTAGTGSAIAGRGPGGEEWSLSWWGQERLGATGMGQDALSALFLAEIGFGAPTPEDGLAPGESGQLAERLGRPGESEARTGDPGRNEGRPAEPSPLWEALLTHYGEPSVRDLLHSFTRRHDRRPWQDKGLAARVVLQAAADSDPVATGIVHRHAVRTAEYARVAAGRCGFDVRRDPVPVVLAGSVLGATPAVFADALRGELHRAMPGCRPVSASLPPVAGAALDALAEAGVPVTAGLLATLTESLPDPSFLAT
jgi:N-acetylglucosamine kinase-like BadF-type ATPase